MSEVDQIIRFLHTVPMFQGLNERQLNRLAKRFKERNYAKGETIVTQGTLGIGLFIIEKGTKRHGQTTNEYGCHLQPSVFRHR